MFGIRKTRTGNRPTATPRLRTRLGCEQLGDRINPTTIGDFTGGGVTGAFTYDETQVNPDLSSQTIVLSDFQFTASPNLHYVADTAPVAHLAYGQFVSMDAFDASCDNYSGEPDLTISVDGTTATILNQFTQQTTQTQVSVDIQPQGVVIMDFTNFVDKNIGKVANADTLTITVTCTTQAYQIIVNIGQGSSPAGTAAAVAAALQDNGFANTTVNNGVVTLKGPGPNSRAISDFSLSHDANANNNDPTVNKSGF